MPIDCFLVNKYISLTTYRPKISILQGVSNDLSDTLLSSEMRYEYVHLEAAKNVDVAKVDIAGYHEFGQNLVDVTTVEIPEDHKYASINMPSL